MGQSVCVFEFRYAKSNLHIGEYLNEASVDRHAPKNLSRMVHSVVEFHMSTRSFFLTLVAAVSAFSLLATPTQANDGDRRARFDRSDRFDRSARFDRRDRFDRSARRPF